MSVVELPLLVEVPVALALAGAHAVFLMRGYNEILNSSPSTPELAASWVPLVLPFAYLAMIFMGRMLMKSQTPYSMKYAMAIYNAYSTVLSGIMCYHFVVVLAPGGLTPWTTPFPASATHGHTAAAIFWVAMHSKYLEFADTLFFVLRKKDIQISTLHVVHHFEMGPLMWLYLVTDKGSYNSCFGPMINAGIHTVMYFYYGVTGLGGKLNFVKPFITTGQITQFLVILAHASFHALHWNRYWSAQLAIMEIGLMIQMLWMFGDFFKSAYLGKAASVTKAGKRTD